MTVGIIDAYASPTIASDSNRYASTHGDGSYGPGQLSQVLPASSSTRAPVPTVAVRPVGTRRSRWTSRPSTRWRRDSNIVYYGAVSCYDSDILDTQTQVVDQNAVDIVTNSYGEPEEVLGADAGGC